jgi:hypothetical protein
VITWNIAAVNNNPFEYWVTHDDPAYNKLMSDAQDFIDCPNERDVKVGSAHTHIPEGGRGGWRRSTKAHSFAIERCGGAGGLHLLLPRQKGGEAVKGESGCESSGSG